MTGWLVAALLYVLAWPYVGLLVDLGFMYDDLRVRLGEHRILPMEPSPRVVRVAAVIAWPLGALLLLWPPRSRAAIPSPSSTGDDDG